MSSWRKGQHPAANVRGCFPSGVFSWEHERIEIVAAPPYVVDPEPFAVRAVGCRLQKARQRVERGRHLSALGSGLRGISREVLWPGSLATFQNTFRFHAYLMRGFGDTTSPSVSPGSRSAPSWASEQTRPRPAQPRQTRQRRCGAWRNASRADGLRQQRPAVLAQAQAGRAGRARNVRTGWRGREGPGSERAATWCHTHAQKVRPTARRQCLPSTDSDCPDQRALILATNGGEARSPAWRLAQGPSPESAARPGRSGVGRPACSSRPTSASEATRIASPPTSMTLARDRNAATDRTP